MMSSPVHYLLVGLLFGTVFLTLGVFLGIWLSKKKEEVLGSESDSVPAKKQAEIEEEMKRVADVVSDFAQWTAEFQSEFTKYQSEMDELNVQASEKAFELTRDNFQQMLKRISEANRQLKVKLDKAERKLEEQSKMLAGYLTEARTDALTGLLNRRAFDYEIEVYFQGWQDSNSGFALALVDIDHFKSVNDTYGHPVGDVVLRESAKLLANLSNETIHVFRYGGEEFAILMPLNLASAAAFAEEIRKAFENLIVRAHGQELKVTLSIGVSHIMADDRIGKLVRRSDEALYSAKLAGRNRVFLHNGSMCHAFGSPVSLPVSSVPAESLTPNLTPAPLLVGNEPTSIKLGTDASISSQELEQEIRARIEDILNRKH